MTVKGVKLKSKSFFSISCGVFGVMKGKLLRADPPPGLDRVYNKTVYKGVDRGGKYGL